MWIRATYSQRAAEFLGFFLPFILEIRTFAESGKKQKQKQTKQWQPQNQAIKQNNKHQTETNTTKPQTQCSLKYVSSMQNNSNWLKAPPPSSASTEPSSTSPRESKPFAVWAGWTQYERQVPPGVKAASPPAQQFGWNWLQFCQSWMSLNSRKRFFCCMSSSMRVLLV